VANAITFGPTAVTPGAITTGASFQTTIAVTGVQLGDYPFVSYDAALNGNIDIIETIPSTGNVLVTFRNPTGGTITPANGNIRGFVIPKASNFITGQVS